MAEINPEKILGKENGFDMREPFNENIEDKIYQSGQKIGERLWRDKGGTKGPRIVVAGDNRFGSSELKKRLIDGLREYNSCIIDLGENLPTPLAYVGFELYEADGVAVVTSSHSPNLWTGIKVNFREENDPCENHKKFVSHYREEGLGDFYKMLLKEKFAGMKQLKVAIDPLWGSYAGYAAEIFQSLGHLVISDRYLHNEKNGFYPGLEGNSPDPHKEKNLENLIEAVKRGRLELGVAFDGDGDRVKFIDDKGRIISEDEITALLAKHFIERHKEKYGENSKPKIIVEIKSSKLVEDMIHDSGGELVREQTGRIYIKKKMASDPKIIFGGELSGHYFYRKNFCGEPFYFVDTGEDGLFTALLVGKILGETKVKLSELIKPNPYLTSGEIRYTYKKGQTGQNKEELGTEINEILQQLKISYRRYTGGSWQGALKVIGRGEDTRVEWGGEGRYCSVIFRNSKNDPQKFTLVFEGKSQDNLDYVQKDFLNRLGALDQKYSDLKNGLEKIFSARGG